MTSNGTLDYIKSCTKFQKEKIDERLLFGATESFDEAKFTFLSRWLEGVEDSHEMMTSVVSIFCPMDRK
jgi:hypothetical protein